MKLIDKYESFQRGVYSGSVGYINETDDFDFNVVIRSIIHPRGSENLYFPVGSAITHYANPEEEYEECMLKAKAIVEMLTTNRHVE
jgi:para-aminobenzoate synthetase component 1